MEFDPPVHFLEHLIDLEKDEDANENDNDKNKKKKEKISRVPPVHDYTRYNIHTFFNMVKSKIYASDNDNNSQNEQYENTNQDTRQSHRIMIESEHKCPNRLQISYVLSLEEVFNFSNTDAKIIDRRKNNNNNNNKRAHMNYADLHMQPEIMESVPKNFRDDWFVVPYPEGQRTILVSNMGVTKMYSETGIQLDCFKSTLPGGVRFNSPAMLKSLCSVLDCIWLKNDRKIYILDALYWCRIALYHYEAERRFLFLKNQIERNITLLRTRVEGRNDYSIILLPFEKTSKNISEFLKEITEINIDKIVFYYKYSLYLNGSTPCVLWLKPFMLPEVLGVEVPQQYIQRPEGYTNSTKYLCEVRKNDCANDRVKRNKTSRKSRNHGENIKIKKTRQFY